MEILPKELNSKGCTLLCQAIFCKAIKDNDKEFLHTDFGEIVTDLANKDNLYDLDSIIRKTTKAFNRAIDLRSYNLEQIIKDSEVMNLEQLAEAHNTTVNAMRIFCSKNRIRYVGKKIIRKTQNQFPVIKKKNKVEQLMLFSDSFSHAPEEDFNDIIIMNKIYSPKKTVQLEFDFT